MLNIAVIGYGYWGPNLVRSFASFPDVKVKVVCDIDLKALDRLQSRLPDIAFTTDSEEIFQDESIHAVVIALPAELHGEFARQALISGKHVFVEKPLALAVSEAEDLVQLSEQTGQILMVGHLLLFHPAVERLKQLIDLGELGLIYYLYSQRLNLGLVRTRENALWSLAPHDVSIMLYLLDELPYAVSATGSSYLQEGIEDTVFIHLKFSEKKMAHIHVSWLDPQRVRRITVVGSKKMAVFNDVEPVEKIKVFDRSFEPPAAYSSYGDALTIRFGDIYIPHVEMAEPLRLECRHFADCVIGGAQPLTNAAQGLEVVRVLDAAHRSLKDGGTEIAISGPETINDN
jgi:predicted dehydrogenase